VRRLLAVAAVVALAVGGLALMLRPQIQSEQTVVRETVQDLVTFQLSRRPFDIAASDPAIVRAWFDGKLRFQLPPLKARAAGYALVGSRLCWLLGRRGGAFSYQHGERLMTLYVIQGDAVELSGGSVDPVLGTMAVRRQVAAYGSLVWRRGDLVFSLVSDASDEEMTAFAATVISNGDEAATQRDFRSGSLRLALLAGER
jgi:anti-sigma factor RsiW